jgi:hypothetical protein
MQAPDDLREAGMRIHAVRAAFCVLSIIAGLLAPAMARACPGRVIFADNFQSMDPAWGKPDQSAFVTPNHAFGLAALPNGLNGRLYSKYLFKDVDICVSSFVAVTKNAQDIGGLVFWASDNDDYYLLAITAAGTFAVLRDKGGRWSTAVSLTKTGALKTGTNVANDLQIGLAGNQATITINGQQIGSFTGQAPPNGGLIGLEIAAEGTGVTEWGFFNLSVTDPAQAATGLTATLVAPPTAPSAPQVPAPVASTCTGNVVYSDAFQSFDSSAWGPIDNLAMTVDTVMGSGLILTAKPNSVNVRQNSRTLDQNVNICVGVSLTAGSDPLSVGGLVFWTADPNNYYGLIISSAGSFSVSEQSGAQSSTPVPWTKSSALRTGTNVINELEVSLAGKQVTIIINGQQVASFTGEPPPGGNHIGLVSYAGGNAGTAWVFSQLNVTESAATQTQPAAASVAGSGCPGKLLYGDQFTTLDPAAWGAPDSYAFAAPGTPALDVVALSGTTNGRLNVKHIYRNVDICVSVDDASSSAADESGGLVFWASDSSNFYYVAINAGGKFAVVRNSAGVWSVSVPWTQTAALKTGAGAVNALQLNLVGNQASLVLNGRQVTNFTGQPPPTGGMIGFFVAAGNAGATTWAFQQLGVTDPTLAAPVAATSVAPPAPAGTPTLPASTPAAAPTPSILPASAPVTPAPAPAPTSAAAPAAPAAGVLYAADFSSENLMLCARRHVGPESLTIPATLASSLALDRDGNIYTTSFPSRSVSKIKAIHLDTFSIDSKNAESTIGSPALSAFLVLAVALDSHDNVFVLGASQASDAILEFPAGSTGDSLTPSATIAGDSTGLIGAKVLNGALDEVTGPIAMAFDSQDNLYVLVRKDNADNAEILKFAAGSNGNVAPVATIAGNMTGLYFPTGLTIDARGTIYVVNRGKSDYPSGKVEVPPSVTVYAKGSSGNSRPIATISGDATQLVLPGAITLDGKGDIWVSTGSRVNDNVLDAAGAEAFAPGSNGNVKPLTTANESDCGNRDSPSGIAIFPRSSVGPLAYGDAAPPPAPTPAPPPPPADATKAISIGINPSIPLAGASTSGTLLYSADFSAFDPSWGAASPWASVANGNLVLKSGKGQPVTWRFNSAYTYRNAEFHLKLAPAAAGTTSEASFIFWATDFTSLNDCACWTITIDPAGTILVEQLVGGNVSGYISGYVRNPAITPGPDGWYDLDVRLDGVQGTISVNGTQVVQFPARPPDHGGLIGLATQSIGAWEFGGLTATSVSLAMAPADAK